MCRVLEDCTALPFNRVVIFRFWGSSTSSAVTSAGPSPPVPGKILTGRQRMLLKIPHTTVVEAGISGDVTERGFRSYVAAAEFDHDRQFSLIVKLIRDCWLDQGLPVADQGIGRT